MNQPNRHHYIPIFYLRKWTGEDGRLCEFSRPYTTVKRKWKFPAATGYVDGLYTIRGLPPDEAHFVEREFMKLVDDWAAKALRTLLQPHPRKRDLEKREHIGWARFIFSLMLRNPEQIERFRAQAATREIPAPMVEAMLPNFINSIPVISKLVQEMTFHTIDTDKASNTLLTSDRPIIMSDGLAQDDAHVVIPIAPTRLFMAVRQRRLAQQASTIDSTALVRMVNHKVAEQAIRYVYAVDDSQFRFVANRLGKMVPSTPLG